MGPGDWICRSCWKSNRSHDELCYRCRAPRGYDPSQPAAMQPASASVRGDALIPPLLVSLPAAFLRIYVVLNSLNILPLGFLFVISLFALGREYPEWPVHPTLFTSAAVVLFVVLNVGIWKAANAITRRRRWGYIVGLVMTAPTAALSLVAALVIPTLAQAEWWTYVRWVTPGFYGILALLSLAALAASFVRRDVAIPRTETRS